MRDGQCPDCGALERHRLFALWLDQNPGALRDRRVLHFAPETTLALHVRPLCARYDTADIDAALADMVIDIENIALDDGAYDTILCFHVLEHVDDAKALAELRRILSPGGTLLVMVPIVEGWDTTFEDPSVTDPGDRERLFGQSDHVRYYGADLRARITEAGFDLTEFTAREPAVSRYGLLRGEKLFICRRPS